MALGEFDLIRRYFQRDLTSAAVALGIGDDAALLRVPDGQTLAISTDTLVAGRHFPLDTAAYDIGWKALAVNLSDLAAMAATPLAFTLNLSLPEADEAWFAEFTRGLFALADTVNCPLIGGDTTRGPLVITITVMGAVSEVIALRRSTAQAGDLICVSGSVGDAGAGLALALGQASAELRVLPAVHREYLLQRLNRPEPRLALAQQLSGHARAAMDISDGLLQDLGHLLSASGVGAVVHAEALPLSPALRTYSASSKAAAEHVCQWALSAGDDYELLFTWPAAAREQLLMLDQPVHVVGEITADPGLRLTQQGQPWDYQGLAGYQHF